MAWNLADQFNTDLEKESVFDNLPAQTSQLRRDEMLKTDAGKLNTSAEGSFVPDSKIAPLEDPRTRSELNSTSRQLKAEETGNVFDSFEPPRKQTPAPQEQQEPPKELTLGEIVSQGYGIISQVKGLKNGRTGANAREVAREKALDEQFIGMVYSRMGDLFEERNLDRNLVERLGTRPGGGFRTAEEIDRVDRIRREGATIKADDGREITLPKDMDWDQAFEADKVVWAQSVKGSKTKEDDSIKKAAEAQALIKAMSEKGELTPDEQDAIDKLGAVRDSALQLPQGASKLGGQIRRYFKQNQEIEMARGQGLDTFDGVTADQYDSKIAENMNKIQAIAIKHAPSFKNSAERDAWFQNEETKNLPFKMAIGGKPTVVYATEDPNVVTSYIANGKKGPEWVNYNMGGGAKSTEPEAVQTEKSSPDTPNQSGKNLSAGVRPYFENPKALPNLRDKVVERMGDTALNVGDYANTAIRNRVVAPAAEFLAGLAGEELELDRIPNPKPKDRPKQLTVEEKLQVIERLTGGPLKGAGKETIKKVYSKLTQ